MAGKTTQGTAKKGQSGYAGFFMSVHGWRVSGVSVKSDDGSEVEKPKVPVCIIGDVEVKGVVIEGVFSRPIRNGHFCKAPNACFSKLSNVYR